MELVIVSFVLWGNNFPTGPSVKQNWSRPSF
jgi:hypothetical protein